MTPPRNSALPDLLPHLAPDSGEAQIVRIYENLDATQWWSPEYLRQQQMLQLARLIGHARSHVAFYAGRLDGLQAGTAAGVDPAAWATLPLLTKSQIRSNGASLQSRYLPPFIRVHIAKTSGSTGIPLEVTLTSEFWNLFHATKLRLLSWYGWNLREKFVEIAPPRGTPLVDPVRRLPRGELPFSLMFECGPYLRVSIFTEIGWQLDLLEREAPQYLLTHPSNLRLLLRELRRLGRRLPSLKSVRTLGEQFDPELRAECMDVLGVPVFDTYGTTENGYIAIQCPEHDHYHVQSELNLVEVLGEDGRACAPGEIGRVVVTPLHAFSMPLFRYDLGDYAEVGEPCPCGRGLPVLQRIYGRHKELLTLPSGEKRFSTFGSRVFTKFPAVAQFQIAQTSLTGIEARIVADRPLTRIECAAITAGLVQQVGAEFSIRLAFVENIPRTPGGKYMEFISELEPRG